MRGLSYTLHTRVDSRSHVNTFHSFIKEDTITAMCLHIITLLHLSISVDLRPAVGAGACLVEQSVFDDLPQESIEDLSGDLAGVCGGFGKFIL